ncbi:hypothetical protein LTR67_010901 [Exophiala xenobiotica]
MIYGRLQVEPPSMDEALPPYPQEADLNPNNSSSRLNGRLSVSEASIQQNAFDTVRLCFRGVILSSVGCKNAVEDIITLTDIKSISEFGRSGPTEPNANDRARHAGFYFELPTNAFTSQGKVRALPLTTNISGTTRLPQNTGVNDNRAIPGECEVSYWIEAQFHLGGRQVGYLSEQVKISSLYPRLAASLSQGMPLTLAAKPDLLSRCRMQKSPDMSVTLYEPDMLIERSQQPAKRRMILPIAVTIDMQQPSAGIKSIDSRQSIECTAAVKWEVDTRFSVGSAHASSKRSMPGESVQKTTTASTQKETILFRPLPSYDGQAAPGSRNANSASYIATSQLDLDVPDAVSQPSLHCWAQLWRTYFLDVSLSFNGLKGAPKYCVHSRIPLQVSAIGRRPEDIFKDDITIDVAEISDDGDSTDGADSNLVPEAGEAQCEGQRTPTRGTTPPPPYFR